MLYYKHRATHTKVNEMAYVSKELKAELAPKIKAVLKKYGVSGTIGVHHHSSLVVTLRSGRLDLIGDANLFNQTYAERTGQRVVEVKGYYQANVYYSGQEHSVDPEVGKFFEELIAAMKGNRWYNNSDIQSDYFDIAYYIDINVGRWDKPYIFTKAA